MGWLAMGRLLAWSSLGWQWLKEATARRAQSAGARLNCQDGTLQLISTTLIATLGHPHPYFWQVEKSRSMPDPFLGVHGVFPNKRCFSVICLMANFVSLQGTGSKRTSGCGGHVAREGPPAPPESHRLGQAVLRGTAFTRRNRRKSALDALTPL